MPVLLLTACADEEKPIAALRPGGGLEVRVEELAPDSFLIRREDYLDSLLDSRVIVTFLNDSTARYTLYQAQNLRLQSVNRSVLASRAAFRGLFDHVANECLEQMALSRVNYIDEATYQHSRTNVMPRLRQTAYFSVNARTGFGANCLEDEKDSKSSRSSRSYGG